MFKLKKIIQLKGLKQSLKLDLKKEIRTSNFHIKALKYKVKKKTKIHFVIFNI